MKLRFLFLIFLVNLISCDQKEYPATEQKKWNEINESEVYWDYSAFIQAFPETKYFDTAVKRYLLYRNRLWDSLGVPAVDCFNNYADIRFMNNGKLLFENESFHLDSLRQQTLAFIINRKYEPTKPSLKQISIPESDSMGFISKGHVEFLFVPEKQLDPIFKKAVREVGRAIQDYKYYLARMWYQTNYEDLSTSRQFTLDSLLANRIIFWEFSGEPIPPPPNDQEEIKTSINN